MSSTMSLSVARERSTTTLVKYTLHTGHSGFGSRDLSGANRRASANGVRKTSLDCAYSPFKTLKDWRTQSPATIAFVVAIAGIMLPAICLVSNRDFLSIPKIVD